MQLEGLQGAERANRDRRIKKREERLVVDIRSLQKPLKDQYRSDPNASRITIRAKGTQTDIPVTCSVDIGRAIYQAEAHKGVGGAGAGACSGDLLLGALAACAQITCQMVAAAMAIPTESIAVTAEGDLDLRGTLGISKEVPVGFETIQLQFDIVAPQATTDQLRALREKTEQYCVVMQTLTRPPSLETKWAGLG
ncbi:MAG: OsmC family protein [Acidobacteria bacterium]|nr:OsmC family protein [Acidobacteriota bacterium]